LYAGFEVLTTTHRSFAGLISVPENGSDNFFRNID
jgi:hypothetical protein